MSTSMIIFIIVILGVIGHFTENADEERKKKAEEERRAAEAQEEQRRRNLEKASELALRRFDALLASGRLLADEERALRLLRGRFGEGAARRDLSETVIMRTYELSRILEDRLTRGPLFGLFGPKPGDPFLRRAEVEEIAAICRGLGVAGPASPPFGRPAGPEAPGERPDGEEAESMAAARRQADELLARRGGLPADMQRPVSEIALHSLEMLDLARRDPDSGRQALRFLDRYLPKALRLVDESLRRGRDREALKRGAEVLRRLARAFADEKERLRRSDADNWAAEVDALDELLRMRGY